MIGQRIIGQDTFDGGAWFGLERVPQNAVEDAVNAIIDESGGLARRGGSAYFGPSLADSDPPKVMFDGWLATGRTTVQARGATSLTPYALNAADNAWVTLNDPMTTTRSRATALAGILAWVGLDVAGVVYLGAVAGSANWTPAAAGGTIAMTNGSTDVVGTGTTFTTQVKAGDIMAINGRYVAVVRVVDNTHLALASPWPDPTDSPFAWALSRVPTINLSSGSTGPLRDVTARRPVLGQAAGRLLVGYGSRLIFSPRGLPLNFTATDYWEMPGRAEILGIQGIRDSALIFTTQGVFALRNLAYDLTDESGNVQQSLTHLYPELVLWDEFGLATWQDAVVAPCTDGVYLLDGASGPVALTNEAIIGLYRQRIAAGLQMAQAAVFQSRYLVPWVNDNGHEAVGVETWVCDLRRRGWSRWNNQAGTANTHLAVRVDGTTRKLFGAPIAAAALSDLSGTLTPAGAVKNDANGQAHTCQITTRTLTTGTVPVAWAKLRGRFETTDAASDGPWWSVEYSVDRGAWFSLSGTAVVGQTTKTWPVGKRARSIRFRFSTNAAAATAAIRSFEAFYRPSGRQ